VKALDQKVQLYSGLKGHVLRTEEALSETERVLGQEVQLESGLKGHVLRTEEALSETVKAQDPEVQNVRKQILKGEEAL